MFEALLLIELKPQKIDSKLLYIEIRSYNIKTNLFEKIIFFGSSARMLLYKL